MSRGKRFLSILFTVESSVYIQNNVWHIVGIAKILLKVIQPIRDAKKYLQ